MGIRERRARILIADDDWDIACTVLGLEGYVVETAFDGVQAIERIPQFDPDVIVLDLMMPRMNGFEVLDRLREDRNTTPVVIMSANQGYEAWDLRVAARVRKPFRLKQILDAIAAALGTRSRA